MNSPGRELEVGSGNRAFGKSLLLSLDAKNEPSFNR